MLSSDNFLTLCGSLMMTVSLAGIQTTSQKVIWVNGYFSLNNFEPMGVVFLRECVPHIVHNYFQWYVEVLFDDASQTHLLVSN